MHYWLFKSEPGTFSIDRLAGLPKQATHWDGVRNYQARNMLRDEIQVGDQAFFYHSGCTPPGIVGMIEIVRSGYPDFTALDPASGHYDPDSRADRPRWYMVDVRLLQKFPAMITLDTLKSHPELQTLAVVQKGNRLSITPVPAKAWRTILSLVPSA